MSKSITDRKTNALFKTAVFTCMSTALAAAADVMYGATASSPLPSDKIEGLIDEGYNNYARQSTAASGIPGVTDGSAEFTVTLAEPSTFATIFINNSCRTSDQ